MSCTSVDDVIFTQWSELAGIKVDAYVSYNFPSCGIGGEVCRFRLHLVIFVFVFWILLTFLPASQLDWDNV